MRKEYIIIFVLVAIIFSQLVCNKTNYSATKPTLIDSTFQTVTKVDTFHFHHYTTDTIYKYVTKVTKPDTIYEHLGDSSNLYVSYFKDSILNLIDSTVCTGKILSKTFDYTITQPLVINTVLDSMVVSTTTTNTITKLYEKPVYRKGIAVGINTGLNSENKIYLAPKFGIYIGKNLTVTAEKDVFSQAFNIGVLWRIGKK